MDLLSVNRLWRAGRPWTQRTLCKPFWPHEIWGLAWPIVPLFFHSSLNHALFHKLHIPYLVAVEKNTSVCRSLFKLIFIECIVLASELELVASQQTDVSFILVKNSETLWKRQCQVYVQCCLMLISKTDVTQVFKSGQLFCRCVWKSTWMLLFILISSSLHVTCWRPFPLQQQT